MLTATKQEQHRVIEEGTEWKDGPACLRLSESEWQIKQDIMEDAKESVKENIGTQKQGPDKTFPTKNQQYQILGEENKHRLSESHPLENAENADQEVAPTVAGL